MMMMFSTEKKEKSRRNLKKQPSPTTSFLNLECKAGGTHKAKVCKDG